MSNAVKVTIRCRPLNSKEKKQKEKVIVNPTKHHGKMRKFTFDRVFWSANKKDKNFCEQIHVYEYIGNEVLAKSFDGFNTCVFAYGQTSSGKSYTIMGNEANPGLVPRICSGLFEKKFDLEGKENGLKIHVECSMIEIYNEKVRDLFNPSNPKNQVGLKVREHPKTGPYVDGLEFCTVKSAKDIEHLLEEGNKYRTIAETQMNKTSSRAHTIFTIMLQIERKVVNNEQEVTHTTSAKINLVDLAGSERVSKTGATGARFKEGTNINLSLNTLGNVITQLAKKGSATKPKMKKRVTRSKLLVPKKKRKRRLKGSKSTSKLAVESVKSKGGKKDSFVSYRDSTLTWLLKESLGGNSSTFMVAAISPAEYNYSETISTLKYANRAKSIQNKAVKNEDKNVRMIRELKAEIEKLKKLLEDPTMTVEGGKIGGGGSREGLSKLQMENKSLLEKLKESQELINMLNRSTEDKEKRTAEINQSRKKHLENYGIIDMRNSKLSLGSTPHMKNLSEDPQMNERLMYFFSKDSKVSFGKGKKNDIVLNGLGILDEHGTVENTDNTIFLVPKEDARVTLNGEMIKERKEVAHDDICCFGNNFIFRFVNPLKKRKIEVDKGIMNWGFAKEMILKRIAKKEFEKIKFDRDQELLQIINQLKKRKVEEKKELQEIGKKKEEEQKETAISLKKNIEVDIKKNEEIIKSFEYISTRLTNLRSKLKKVSYMEKEMEKLKKMGKDSSDQNYENYERRLKSYNKKKLLEDIKKFRERKTAEFEEMNEDVKDEEVMKNRKKEKEIEMKIEVLEEEVEKLERKPEKTQNDAKMIQDKTKEKEKLSEVLIEIEEVFFDSINSCIRRKITKETKKLDQIKLGIQKKHLAFSMTISRGNLIDELANNQDLLNLIQKIKTANEIAEELKRDIVFSLKIFLKSGDVFIFVKAVNRIKKVVSFLPEMEFTRRLIMMQEFYQSLKADEKSLVPFDSDPFQKPYCYEIGKASLSLDSLLNTTSKEYVLRVFDDKKNNVALLRIKVCSMDNETIRQLFNGDNFDFKIEISSITEIPSNYVRELYVKFEMYEDDYVLSSETKHKSFQNLDKNSTVVFEESFYFTRKISKEFVERISTEKVDISVFGELFRFYGKAEEKEHKNLVEKNKVAAPFTEKSLKRGISYTKLKQEESKMNNQLKTRSSLTVTVLEGKDILPTKSSSSSLNILMSESTYVKLKYRSHKRKTTTKSGTSNPKWNEKLKIPLVKPNKEDVLMIEVTSKKGFFKTVILGRIFVKFEKIFKISNQKMSEWFPFDEKSGKLKLLFDLK